MPLYEIEVNGQTYEIEAESEAQLERAQAEISGQFPVPPTPAPPEVAIEEPVIEREWTGELQRQVGLTARAAAEGGAGALGIFSDPIAAIINQFLPEEKQLGMLHSTVKNLLTEAGVPEPETATEEIVQQASQALVGVGGGLAAARGIGRAAISPITREIVKPLVARPAEELLAAAGAGAGQQIAEEAELGPAGQIAATMVGGLAGVTVAKVPKILFPSKEALIQKIKIDPTSADVAEVKLVGGAVQKDRTASEVVRQGFQPSVVASTKTGSNKDKFNMLKMLHVFKKGKKDAVYAAKNRPSDVLGESMNERVKYILDTNKNAGKEIEVVAKKLKTKTIDTSDAVDSLMNDLDDIGVAIGRTEEGKLTVSLRGSNIEGDIASKGLLKNVLNRLKSIEEGSAYDAHRAKRYIDTQVSYGKTRANPLSKETERIVKKFRSRINDTLGEASGEYKAANTKYKDTLEALEGIQKAVGASVDMQGGNVPKAFGTSLRKILSNYGSRVQMMDSVANAESTAVKYGMKMDDDLIKQLIFSNEIDRMFGSFAPTSFKGQIESATKQGLDMARKSALETAIDLTSRAGERIRGINEENAIKAIEKMLKEK